MKGLLDRGLAAELVNFRSVIKQLHDIDRLLDLPKQLQVQFASEIYAYEKEKEMPYVTSIERLGIEKGGVFGRIPYV